MTILLGFLIILSVKCDLLELSVYEAVDPILSDLVLSPAIFLQTDVVYPVTVEAEDPQGTETLDVTIRIMSGGGVSILTDAMTDNGEAGDILPRDGQYFYGLTTNVFASEGLYRIEVSAEDADGHLSNTVIDTVDVVDDVLNLPPSVMNPIIPDSLNEATSGDVFLSIEATDPQGNDDIDSVYFRVYLPYQPMPSYIAKLFDDGTHGDENPNDGQLSFRGSLSDVLTVRGDYLVTFHAVDKGGLSSKAEVVGLYMDVENRPPTLSNLSAPDTVSRNEVPSFLLSVQVDDPQGPEDIRLVFFNTIKPDGSPSSGNPFEMVDDGTQGDEGAGDGVYSLRVEITPDNALGAYRFEFYAEDYSGARSDALIHTITVID